MSILNVNQIQPVGSGQTVTISAANLDITGNLKGVTSSGISTFSSGVDITGGQLRIGTTSGDGTLRVFGDSGRVIIGDTSVNYYDADTHVFRNYAAAQKVTINSSGNIVLAGSGQGIDFSATADGTGMVSETLSDYEEGEWTPEIVGSTDGTATASTGAGSGGWYVRVGNTVWLNFYFANPTITGTMSGDLRLNLPFTQANNDRFDNGGGGPVTYTRNFSSGGSDRRITLNVDRGLSYARFKTLYDNATTETANLTQAMASLTTTTLIKGNMIMRVD